MTIIQDDVTKMLHVETMAIDDSGSFRNYARADDITEQAAMDVYDSIITDEDVFDESEEVRWLRHERLAHKSLHWSKRPSLLMAVSVLVLAGFSNGLSMLSELDLMMRLICRSQFSETTDTNSDLSTCDRLEAQKTLSRLIQVSNIAGGTLSIATSSQIGRLSDIYGRKPLIIYCLICRLLSLLSDAYLLGPNGPKFNLVLFALNSCIIPLAGGATGLSSVLYSYVIDTVEEEHRIFSIGVLNASFSIGISIAPVLSSLMLKTIFHSPVGVLYMSVTVATINLLFGTFLLPESRSERSKRNSFDISQSVRRRRSEMALEIESKSRWFYHVKEFFKSIFQPFKLFWLPAIDENGLRNTTRRKSLVMLVLTDALWSFCTSLVANTIALYVMYIFEWGAIELGYYISLLGASRLIVLLIISPIILRFVQKRFKPKKHMLDNIDLTMMRFSYIFQFLGLILVILARTSGQFMATTLVTTFSVLFQPAIRAAIAKFAPAESVGGMMGALSSLDSFVDVIGPAIFIEVYSKTLATEPRTFLYALLAILLLCGVFLFSLSTKPQVEDSDPEQAL